MPEDPGPDQRRPAPQVGKRTELARYRLPGEGERVIYAQRVNGVVRLTDRPHGPVSAERRAYLIERGLETKPELDALIADYLAQTKQLNAVPMSVIPLESYLEAVA